MFSATENSRMKTRLLHLWETLRTSYWFVPTLMSVLALVMALVMVEIDRSMDRARFKGDQYFYIGGAEGARSLLSTVASSVITVAGVVFSITIAALTQASSQFGPRLLRNFMRDTGNQIVLGTFVSTFLYCLLVLRTVHGANEGEWKEFVPHLSVTVAVGLAVCSLAVLIYFIHHVSASLQAPAVAASVARDLDEGIERIFPEKLGKGSDRSAVPVARASTPPDFDATQSVCSDRSGYVQAIDADGIMQCAAGDAPTVLRLNYRPGDFVIAGQALAHVWPSGRATEELCERVRGMFYLGDQRTAEQDIEYSVDQLVEIAIRALSPGINDPFTAIQCVDWLGDAMARLSRRAFPSEHRHDESTGRLCVIARVTDVEGVVDAAFNQIRQYGRNSVAVTARLLETFRDIGQTARQEPWRRELLRHCEMVYTQAQKAFDEPHDLRSIESRYDEAVAMLNDE